jgi:hypothetical protein
MKTALAILAAVLMASPAFAGKDKAKISGTSVTGYRITTRDSHTYIPPRPRGPGWYLTCSYSGRVQSCIWLKS